MVDLTARSPVGERRLVETFVELADTLVEDFDLLEFLATLSGRVVELGLATEAGILLADETGDLQFVAASHERAQLLELFQVQAREGPCMDCFRTGAAVLVDDLEGEVERWPAFAPRALEAGFRSVQAVPLRLRGTRLGALNLFLTRTGGVHAEGRTIVQGMADVATIGLLQQREIHRAHDVERQLQQALHSRVTVEQAKGILSEQTELEMVAAFELLRAHARRTSTKLGVVARLVVEGTLTATDLATPPR